MVKKDQESQTDSDVEDDNLANELEEESWEKRKLKKALAIGGGVAVGAVTAVVAAPLVIAGLGFGAGGIAAGTEHTFCVINHVVFN